MLRNIKTTLASTLSEHRNPVKDSPTQCQNHLGHVVESDHVNEHLKKSKELLRAAM